MGFQKKFSVAILLIGTQLFGWATAAETERPEITISGFFDGYYSFNFNNPRQASSLSAANVSSATIPAGGNTYRYYDIYHNQLSLSLAELSVKASFKEVSLLTDFDFGTFADLHATASSSAGLVVDESAKHIGQAVISYKPTDSRFSFDAGKMYSHLGVETVKSKDNFNYSRSLLFSYAIPFWHTGARLGYDAIPGKFQMSFFIYNGWNSVYDTNRSKTLGAQIRYMPSEKTTVVYNFIGGPERTDSESDSKTVHELNVATSFTDSLSLIADAVYGYEENALVGTSRVRASWYGGLVALRHKLSSVSYLSPRLEMYRDNNGYTLGGLPQTINSLTLTYGCEVTTGLEVRFEARGDFSNENSFTTDSGTSKSQTTLLVAGLFKF